MEFKSYIYPKYGKSVKFTSSLTKHVNAYKNLITLLSCQPLNSTLILEYNTTSHPNFLLYNNKEVINLRIFKNDKEKIRPADINMNKKNIRLIDIDK